MAKQAKQSLDTALAAVSVSPRGKRGPKKGAVYAKTIAKEEAKEILRQEVLAHLKPILRASIKSAVGVDHFMLRDPETGQFRRLTELSEIEAALNHPGAAEGKSYWIHTKDPNIQAAADLLNRAIGKPVEEVQLEANVETRISWAGGE